MTSFIQWITGTGGFALVVLLLALGIILHIINLERILRKIKGLVGSFTRSDLFKDISIQQGSNFDAMAITAWLSVFTAIGFLFFFTPDLGPGINYFQIKSLASQSLGFAIFGVGIAAIVALAFIVTQRLPKGYKISEVYTFYSLSMKLKLAMAATVVLLWISITLSAYRGTIYPETSDTAIGAAFILIVISIGILLFPIYKEFLEGV